MNPPTKELIKDFLEKNQPLTENLPLFKRIKSILKKKERMLGIYIEVFKQCGCTSNDEIAFRIIELFLTKKRKWKKDTQEMSAFEYTLSFEYPNYFLFDKRGSALIVLLEEYLREEGPSWWKDTLKIRDNAGRVLEKNFKKANGADNASYYTPREWQNAEIMLKQPDNINNILTNMPISYEEFKKLTYEKKIQRIFEELMQKIQRKIPLRRTQIISTMQRLMKVSAREISIEELHPKNKQGEKIAPAQELIRDPNALDAREEFDKEMIKETAQSFFDGLSLAEKKTLRLRKHHEISIIPYAQIAKQNPELGSLETIRRSEKSVFSRMGKFLEQKQLGCSAYYGIFIKFFLEFLEKYNLQYIEGLK